MKKLILLPVVLLIGAALYYGLPQQQKERKADLPVAGPIVAKAEERNISFSVEVSGDVTPVVQLEVKPEVGGKLKRLLVDAGQQVKAGQLLCEIDDRELLTEKASVQTEIEGATLSMDKSRRNFDRAKGLYESKLISREVFDNLSAEYLLAENGLKKSQRRMDTVEDKLAKTKIYSPTNGTVLSVGVTEGQVVVGAASVNSGTSLMVLADLSRLRVDTHVNQVDVARLANGQQVQLRSESLPDLSMSAAISFIAPVASVKNGTKGFQVQALIDEPNPQLRPGMTVSLTIPIEHAEHAVSVPIAAVFRGENDKHVVYVRNGDQTEKREVELGVTNLNYAQIKTGLKVGDEILLVEPALITPKS